MPPASGVAGSGLTLVRSDLHDPLDTEPSDRRVHPRLTLSELDWLNTVRLKYGPVVELIDLSCGGAQIETASRLHPGAVVVVQISGPGGEVAVPSTVVRSQVSRVTPYAMYRSALSFKRDFDAPRAPSDRGTDGFANLLAEHVRMTGAIRRLSHSRSGGSSLALPGDEILTATLALLQSPAGRRASDGLRPHLTQLFRELTRGIESGAGAEVMRAGLADRLRRAVPARVIRLTDRGMPVGPHGPDTIFFDAATDGSANARLVVEFPRNCQLEEWHLHFLKIAAQLAALITEVSALGPDLPGPVVEPVSEAAPAPAPVVAPYAEMSVPLSTTWIKVVARYADGRVLKGYCRGFIASRGYLSVSPGPDALASQVTTVMLRHLKAVFFVHDLDGVPPGVEATATARGRDIVVTFMDGEVLSGTTLNYAVDSCGFFVSPHEQRGNNLRIFVVNDAVRLVQFP